MRACVSVRRVQRRCFFMSYVPLPYSKLHPLVWYVQVRWQHYKCTAQGNADVQNYRKWRFAGMNVLLKAVLNSSGPGQYIRQGASKRTRCAAAIAP